MRRRLAKPPNCPTCGKKMVPVVYGFPGGDLVERAERGEVIIGGCIPMGRNWSCVDCPPDRLEHE